MNRFHRGFIAFISAIVFACCSHQALTIQAKIATSAHPLIEQSHNEIAGARMRALREAARSEGTEDQIRERIVEVEAHFEPLLIAYSMCRSSFNAWQAIMVRALTDESVSIEMIEAAGREFMELYDELIVLAEFFGLNLPVGGDDEQK